VISSIPEIEHPLGADITYNWSLMRLFISGSPVLRSHLKEVLVPAFMAALSAIRIVLRICDGIFWIFVNRQFVKLAVGGVTWEVVAQVER
jgi:hypothetical protein